MQNAFRLSPRECRRLLASLGFVLCCMATGLHEINTQHQATPILFTGPCTEGASGLLEGRIYCLHPDKAGAQPLRGLHGLLLGVPMDLNQASAQELILVPGIGQKLARRIVISRKESGDFHRMSDLQRVRGIGPKLRSRAEQLFSVNQP